jgi:Sulfotransferase family
VSGWWTGFRHRGDFADVNRFAFFIGYPRSGHTLIGSLLNAHPQMVISHELNVFPYVSRHVGRLTLYGLILQRDAVFAEMDRRWEDYDYTVPNLYQGTYESLRVIGDKRGAGSNRWLTRDPTLLERLRRTVGVPLRVIHVTRNPYDIAATMARRTGLELDWAIRSVEDMSDGIDRIRRRLPADELYDLGYEHFLVEPRQAMTELCQFLDVEPTPRFLDGCAALVWPSSSRSRDRVEWSSEQRDHMAAMIERSTAFAGYEFDE